MQNEIAVFLTKFPIRQQRMKLIYLDEAGNTGKKADPNQPHHLLAAILVDAVQVRSVEADMRNLADKYFGHSKVGGVEFHGYEIHGGKGAFKDVSTEKRIAVMMDIINLIKINEIQIGWVSIDKIKTPSTKHPHEHAFLFMVERLQDILKAEGDLGLIIADENKDIEQRLIENLDKYKNASTDWGYRPTKIENIIDSVHFVQSKNNWLIQIADITAYLLIRGRDAEKKIQAEYDKAQPTALSITEWVEQFATRTQKVDHSLYTALRGARVRFIKEYP